MPSVLCRIAERNSSDELPTLNVGIAISFSISLFSIFAIKLSLNRYLLLVSLVIEDLEYNILNITSEIYCKRKTSLNILKTRHIFNIFKYNMYKHFFYFTIF